MRTWRGVLFALSAATIYSVYIIVGAQVMRQVSAIQSSVEIFAAAGATSGMLMLWNGPHLPATAMGWEALGAIVVAATLLPAVAFLAGIERIGPTNAAMISTLEPVVTVVLAASLLGEMLGPVSLLERGLILLAVLLLTEGNLRRPAPVRSGDNR